MSNLSTATPEKSDPLAGLEQSREEYERYLRQCDEKHLWSMLLGIQERLGTPAEQAADLEKVQMLAHRLSNLLTAIRLKTDLALLVGTPPGSCAPQSRNQGDQRPVIDGRQVPGR